MGLFDSLFQSRTILGIAEDTLEFVLEASEQTHPHEYMGLFRGTNASQLGLAADGQVITDVLVIPGTESNSVSATLRTNMVPNDRRALGSVHSHPSGVLKPSTQDLQSFSRGDIHMIVGAPYRRDNWRVFDPSGDPIDLDVLAVDLPDAKEQLGFDPDEFQPSGDA